MKKKILDLRELVVGDSVTLAGSAILSEIEHLSLAGGSFNSWRRKI